MKKLNQTGRLWVSWEDHVRSRSLSKRLGAEFVLITVPGGRLKRYAYSVLRTISIVRSRQPTILFIQNPSLVLAILSVFLKNIFNITVVVDAHNAGISPAGGQSTILQWMADFAIRNTHLILITNSSLSTQVEKKGGNPLIVPDPLPSFKAVINLAQVSKPQTNFLVVAICSWADDEPVKEILNSAKHMHRDSILVCTGHAPKWAREWVSTDLPNVQLTGFLEENEYVNLISTANCVIDLTTRNDCLVCGAYESIAIGTPFILSDTPASRSLFSPVAIFTANRASNIAVAVEFIRHNEEQTRHAVATFRVFYDSMWDAKLALLEKTLAKLNV